MKQTIELTNVSKTIGQKEIIREINLSVNEGEVLGLLGPNGAGKTTIIRMLVGLVELTSGQMTICGHDIQTDRGAALEQVGAIVENPELYPFLSGYQNLEYFSRMEKSIPAGRIDALVEFIDLQDRIHEKVKTYSLGMKQRLGIAQALLNSPRVLILDEPTNGLDPAGMKDLRHHLRMLAEEQNVTVIVSSHLLSEIELMCDRIAIIDEGALVTIEDVQEKQNNQYALSLSDPQQAQELLEEHYGLTSQLLDRFIQFALPETGVSIAEIVKLFVDQGLAVHSVVPKRNTLEDRFMSLTTKKERI